MPLLAIALLAVDILCVVHVVRTQRHYYWIYIILFVPSLGAIAYLALELLPEWLRSYKGQQAVFEVARALDPGKAVREGERRVAITPTAENKAALADAYAAAGRNDEAAALYEDALQGIHASDPAMMFGLARVFFAQERFADVQSVLESLRAANPDYHSPDGHLIYARALEAQGKTADALAEYAALVPYYPGQEARCRYALMLRQAGRLPEARRLFEEICQSVDYGPRHQRRHQRQWYAIAKEALGT